MTRLLCILALLATVLSGGGVGRALHGIVAHGGGACSATAHGGARTCAGLGARETAATSGASALRAAATCGAGATQDTDSPRRSSRTAHDCPVCDELAVSSPLHSLVAPFTCVIEVLAIVHDRESAQLAAPDAPRVCAARPPPGA